MTLTVLLQHPLTEGAHPVLTVPVSSDSLADLWEKLRQAEPVRQVPLAAVRLLPGQIRAVLPWVETADGLTALVEELRAQGLAVKIDANMEKES